MVRRALLLVIFATTAIAGPAFAEDGRGFLRQVLVMWLPLIVIVGVWIYFVRWMGASTYSKVIARTIPHMDALEKKLDRIIELLERQASR